MQLTDMHCQALHGQPPMETQEAESYRMQLRNPWTISTDGKKLSHDFRFHNFHETMAFVNAVAWVAHQQDHHPDLHVGYKQCHVTYTTHAVGGLSLNDFICAARIDRLLESAS